MAKANTAQMLALLNTQLEQLKAYETAFDDILKAKTLVEAKELAAEALDVDVDEYLLDDFEFAGVDDEDTVDLFDDMVEF